MATRTRAKLRGTWVCRVRATDGQAWDPKIASPGTASDLCPPHQREAIHDSGNLELGVVGLFSPSSRLSPPGEASEKEGDFLMGRLSLRARGDADTELESEQRYYHRGWHVDSCP